MFTNAFAVAKHTIDVPDAGIRIEDDMVDMEELVRQEVSNAFMAADSVHEQCSEGSTNGKPECEEVQDNDSMHSASEDGVPVEANFDPTEMQEAIQELYRTSKCSKLAATILLMNLCTVHGVSNSFADEMFRLLHGHILPKGNSLSRNYHVARSLTQKLGLSYNSIHACERGCVLFRGDYADAQRCPKCNGPRYRDEQRRRFPLKVLRHFPIIPRLQRMSRSPNISKLM